MKLFDLPSNVTDPFIKNNKYGLKECPYKMVDVEYNSTRQKVQLHCSACGYTSQPKVLHNIQKGKLCCPCSNRWVAATTREYFKYKVAESKYSAIKQDGTEDWEGRRKIHDKTLFECLFCKQKFEARLNDISKGIQPCWCSDTPHFKSWDDLQGCRSFKELEPLTDLVLCQEYKGTNKKYLFSCHQHGLYIQSLHQKFSQGQGCPSCAISGYKPDQAGCFYTLGMKVVSPENDGSLRTVFKIGITNHDVKKRYSGEQAGNWTILSEEFFTDGKVPLQMEQEFKATNAQYLYKNNVTDIEQFFKFSKHTELYIDHPELLKLSEGRRLKTHWGLNKTVNKGIQKLILKKDDLL